MAENLDDFLAVHHFLNKAVHSAQIDLLADIVFPGQLGEIRGDNKHDHRGQDRDHRQRRIQDEHCDQRSSHRDHRVDDLRNALA